MTIDAIASPAADAILPALTLVLGGARSGKSRHAEALVLAHAEAANSRPVYIATAEAADAEMAARIAAHRERRGDIWRNEETLLALAEALDAHSRPGCPVLIDCLTLWLSNVMLADRDAAAACDDLLLAFERAEGPVVCVANEVGLGIVPEHKLGRAFRDRAGILNQQIAALATRVDFIAAGLPLALKSPPAGAA